MRCSAMCAPPHAPDGWSREAQRQHPTYRHYADATGIRCELDADHDGGPGSRPRLHRNGLLTWWNPPLLVVGGQIVDEPVELEETAAVGETAVSGSALPMGEPERAAVSSSSAGQLTVLPGETWEDIFGGAA
jgi:hypothetical protein